MMGITIVSIGGSKGGSMMKFGAALLLVLALSGCSSREQESYSMLSSQDLADRVTGQLVYFKDPTTNLCFAYYWGGTYHGGPALTLVPEDSIPPGRLLIGRPKQ